MLFTEVAVSALVTPTWVLLLIGGVAFIVLGVIVLNVGFGQSNLDPYFDPLAMVLMAILLLGGGGLILLGIAKLFLP